MAASERKWPARMACGAAGAVVAGLPLLAGPCSGTCTRCWRCVAGVSGVLVILGAEKLIRRVRRPRTLSGLEDPAEL